MTGGLSDEDWTRLIKRIKQGRCTPFLGAGVNYPHLPLGRDIAQRWADEKHYPFPDLKHDLTKVAQFCALTAGDAMEPKEELLDRWIRNAAAPDFADQDLPLRVVADLPLPIFMTTNYDDWMARALTKAGKAPRRELCKWNNHPVVRNRASVWDEDPGYRPVPGNPVVYHLHGLDESAESLVLTEDDYIDFLVHLSRRQQELLPAYVLEALTANSLLFIGYSLADMTFQVIFRGLVNMLEAGLRRLSVAVQLPPNVPEADRKKVQEFLNTYYGNMHVKIAWAPADEFAKELRRRWREAV